MLDKTYQASDYEGAIYQKWETSGVFALGELSKDSQPFVVALPPPNANADLHIGHALDFQLKDIFGRWQRLHGHPVLLIPGADHAGFETWAVYEKHLNAKGQSRFDFTREELYQQVYDFVLKNKSNMASQIRRLGISCDWQNFVFTLDKKIVKRAYQTFQQMWQQDLIYRSKRLVNYCTHHGTGFSDFEVTHQEITGKLWFVKYPLSSDKNQSLTISTTRPETLLGDVAVAVHPQDKRYLKFHGCNLKLPLSEREIPVICDRRVVVDFGSGAVKVTPGHDFLDFEIGRDAGLEPREVIGKDGRMSDQVPQEFQGLKVSEARQLVLDRLSKEGLLLKTQAYTHQVGHCYKCGNVLEPLLADQWFVRMQPLAEVAIEKLEQGEIKFYPAAKGRELITYLSQLQDWNISRQIAWGIPIPVFQNQADENDWIFDERVTETTIEVKGQTYRRDPDVFDTWWSSGQWAFATIDWPDNPRLYPNSLMETGVDILRPWVSRMILLSLFVTKQIPFKIVYLHGMVVDQQGVKMSKSKGNVINPMTMIEEYGADVLRIGLCGHITAGQPQKLGQAKITASRNFCNKLWNIGRFVQNSCGSEEATKLIRAKNISLKTSADHWIWARFLQTKEALDEKLTNYQVASAWEEVYSFTWNDLADWYLETCKWQLNKAFLSFLFENVLRLLHPFAPFLTEALYQELFSDEEQPLLINNCWQNAKPVDGLQIESQEVLIFAQSKDLIIKARQSLPLDLRRQSRLVLKNQALVERGLDRLCQQLTNISEVSLNTEQEVKGLFVNRVAGYEAWLILDNELLQEHIFQLEKEFQAKAKILNGLEQRLSNSAYLQKAPAHLVKESQDQFQVLTLELQVLKAEIKDLRQVLDSAIEGSDQS